MYGLDINHLANLLKDTQRNGNDSDSDDDQVCQEKISIGCLMLIIDCFSRREIKQHI